MRINLCDSRQLPIMVSCLLIPIGLLWLLLASSPAYAHPLAAPLHFPATSPRIRPVQQNTTETITVTMYQLEQISGAPLTSTTYPGGKPCTVGNYEYGCAIPGDTFPPSYATFIPGTHQIDSSTSLLRKFQLHIAQQTRHLERSRKV